MGYNGNNRGRTHNWSGVGSKKDYNWGLNLTAKALVAPFYLLGALADIANDMGTSSPTYASINAEPSVKLPSRPHEIIESLIEYYPEISQKISILSKRKNDLLLLKRKLQSIRYNVFLLRKRKRIINVLNYKILRKEQSISSFNIFEKNHIGKQISCNQITGKVVVHFSDQAIDKIFHEGFALKQENTDFHEGTNIIQSLAFNGTDWQMVFYSKGLILEDKKQILFVPYKDIEVNEKWIIHYADSDNHGYDVVRTSWRHTRLDGRPDLRYSCNSPIYYVQLYQVELKFKRIEKETSLYIIFQKKEDSANLCKLISPKYDPKNTEKVSQYSYIRF